MPYVTFFDISKQPFQWWWPAIGLGIVVVGIIFLNPTSYLSSGVATPV
jgi:hypothetical protein